ncbi:CocE/NonD family hydrolase [Umezawaea sp. Da 62-37]|uniref:CocE/NonD family hydrolase n=1 Tax=Umezawaea sp. Da 62-37 TaxID=3075927 RepID=UPI0028F70E23|nr:CocE/NonD family hydrolase [Umezawaea sp. Da 62-37]WNV87196.1 CocE/NonD family hydrolase [Umezawaea sp. Da 62-37]
MLDRLIDKVLGLPSAVVPEPVVTRDLAIPMPDGVRLLADRYRPPGTEPLPVVLVRSPYGRRGAMGTLFGAAFARRGFQVVVQSVRGTFGSGGEFRAFRQEKEDGLATAAWLRAQPWCDGRLAMAGASYLGHTQWAVAPYLDPPLEAMCLGVTASEFTSSFYPGGVLALDNMLSWSATIGTQEKRFAAVPNPIRQRRTRKAMSHLPLRTADVAAIGGHVPFLEDVVTHAESRESWAEIDHGRDLAALGTPTSMVTGWYDLFISQQLRDFKALQAAGARTRLTVGPWKHGEPASFRTMVDDQVSWLAAHLLDDRAQLHRPPVRIFLQKADRWLDFEQWPPAESKPRSLQLQAAGGLGDEQPEESSPDRFTYNPADPTPTVGGPMLVGEAKQHDNRSVEARADVLVYTGMPLERDLDVIGEVSATIHVRTSTGHADVFVRLCDVDAKGVSLNVTDGVLRLPTGDGITTAEVALDPTAYRFRRGHRLRVQVSGGAFPRFARNHGNDAPTADAVAAVPTRFEVFHDPEHPSGVSLAVFG